MSLHSLHCIGLGLAAIASLASPLPAQIGFDGAVSYPINSDPRETAVGDWDQDGDLDLAVTSDAPEKVSLLFNAGDGTFGAPVDINLSAGSSPEGIIAGDFDDDGFVDLAVTRSDLDDVQILENQGGGAFVLGPAYAVGTDPEHVITDRFDNNDSLDLAVSNNNGFSVSVLLNQGDGTFGTANNVGGFRPRGLAAADLDQDGDVDLAVATTQLVRIRPSMLVILTNDGNGVFSETLNLLMSGLAPRGVAAADLDDDGDNDLASGASGSSHVVRIFLQTSAGVFSDPGIDYPTGGKVARSVFAGDFDLDLDVDVATANVTSNDVTVLPNQGDGTFGTALQFAVDNEPGRLRGGDLDGNGALDLICTNMSGSVSVLINQTDSAFSDLGHGLAGSNGIPQLAGIGTLQDATPVKLIVSNGLPSTFGVLFIGLTRVDLPFAGGTLVPAPDVLLPITLNSAGELDLVGDWPSGISAGTNFFFQVWLVDLAAVRDLAATNALLGVAQ